MYLNQVSLIGFVGKDAELKTTTNNRDFVVLSVATGRSWKDKETQEYKRETDWHRVVAWGNLTKFAQKLKKGEHIFVQGELRPRQYDKQVGKGKDKDTEKMINAWEDYCSDNHIILLCPRAESEAGWLASEAEFIHQVAQDVMAEYTIDRQRIIAHGMGIGGQMA